MYRLEDTPSGTAPSITAAAVSGTPGTTTATVGATVNAGTAQTTVTFKYGTVEGTYNLNPASLSGGTVAANTTGATPSASLTGLTPGTTYFYQWTATNTVGSATRTGSFTASCFDAPTVVSNGTASSVSFTWNDVGATQYVLRVWRDFAGSGGGGTTNVTDTIVATNLVATDTGYKAFTFTNTPSGAKYAGVTSKDANGYIQVKKNSGGIYTTGSGGILKNVKLNVGSGSYSYIVYANTTAYSSTNAAGVAISAGNVTTNIATTNGTSYTHAMIFANSGAQHFSSVQFVWEQAGGGGGSSTTNYYGGTTGSNATSGVSVAVPMPGEYNWKLVAQGGGTCSQTVTGTVTAAAAGCGERWMVGPATAANNDSIAAAGSMGHYVVGETNTTPFYGAINVDTETDGWTAEFGYGTTTNGAGWEWFTAPKTWYDNPNTWHGSTNHVFGSAGTWYTAFRFSKDGCTYYTPKGTAWAEQFGTNALHADRYFEVKDTWAGWMGNSYVVAGGTWYNGHGTENPPAFHGQTIQTNSTGKVALAGEVQTYGSTAAQGPLAAKPHMAWEVRLGGAAVAGMGGDVALPWDRFENNNNYYGRGGTGWTDQNLDFSNLAEGDYSLAVWFHGTSSNGATMYETNASSKVEYVATVPVRASLSRSVGSLENFTATYPNAGGSQSFTVSGTNLTGALTVTAPEGWEVSTTSATTGFGSTATLTPNSTTHKLAGGTVWVRLAAGASVDSHSGSVTVGREGMSASVSVTVSGTVSAGTPTVTRVAETPLVASATVTADVSAMGAVATVGFVYGTSESYGTGGTVSGGDASTNQVAAGTSGRRMTATLANLIAGTDYFYKWTVNNGSHSATLTNWFTTACFGTLPDVTTNTGSLSATLSWLRMDGADHYLVSMWTGGTGWAQVTNEPSNWSGDYVIAAATAARAMNSNVDGYAEYTDVTISSGTIASADAELIWTISGDSTTGYRISNGGWYLNPATSKSVGWSETPSGYWTISVDDSGVVTIANKASTSWILQYNASSPRFACYNSAQQKLRLFTQGGDYATGTVGGVSTTLKDVVIAQPAAAVPTPTVSAAITSLAANTNTGYSWSVTAVGGGTCSAKTEGSGLKVEAAPAARIEVLAGDPLAAVADSFDFGSCEVYAGMVTKTFTVTNAGNAALAAGQLSLPTLSGAGSGAYSVAAGTGWSSAVASGLAAGGTAEFTVTFDPAWTLTNEGATSPGGTPAATVTVPWGVENSTTFGVQATVPAATLGANKNTLAPASTTGYTGSGATVKPTGSHLLTSEPVVSTLSGTHATYFQLRGAHNGAALSAWGNSVTLTPVGGALVNATNQVRLVAKVNGNPIPYGTYSATLTISGGGAPDKVITITGTVYPKPSVSPNHAETTIPLLGTAYLDFSDYHEPAPAGYWYTYWLEGPAGLDPAYYEFDNKTNHIAGYDSGPGDVFTMPDGYGVYVFKVSVTNQNSKATNFTWTVTVADPPHFTTTNAVAVAQSGDDWGASQEGTLDSGGADTTVTFEYRTGGGAWQAGTVLVNGVAGNTVSSNATASSAAAVAGSTTNALTGGSTYDFRWTLESVGGTNVLTGTFFVPGDGLEFPGSWWMNGSDWITTNTTTRDLQFGGGNYYYTPARRLTGDQEFKALKSGTWYGNGAWMTGNHSEHTFTVNTNTANLHLCVTNTQAAFPSAGAGYYTIRGWDTGSGIQYVALYTENAPVTVTNGADNHATAGTGDVTVTAELSGTKSASEKVYVRYTTDGWSTSSLVQMSVNGTTATGTIPGQAKGTTVEWYVLTSPHDAVWSYPDLCTLRGVKSGETNYCYRTEVTPPTVNSVTLGYEQAVLSWNLNAAGQNVMIVRYEGDSPSITAPTDGTTYPADQNLLGGRIVYGSWNGEGLTNGVAQGTHYTYVFYTADGTSYSAGVTVDAGTTKTLGTPVVVMNGDGSMTGEVGGALNLGESYVVVRDTDGTFDAPAGSAAVPAVGAAWCGGTVVYTGTVASVGTEAEFTDTQPTIGCQEYHYWGFLRANGEDIWNMGGEGCGDTATAARPGATIVTSTTTNTDGFALTWTPADRANGYLISIWTTGAATVNTSATYTVTSRTSVSTDGAAPAGSAATFANSYSTAGQATSNNTMRLQLTGYDGKRITGLKLSMKSNKDKGSGSLSVTSGSQTLLSFGNAAFSSASWNGAWSTNYVTIDFSSRLTATTVGAGETLQILISANQNSLYCESYEVIYEGTDSGTDYLSGYGADGGWITNGVAIGGMDPGTDYHYSLWAVGATTNCTGAETTNTVHTEGTAKPNPPGLSLSVTGPDTIVATVTRANGEAWELWRFATAELAAAASEPPGAASAGVVRVGGGTTPATGSTTVTDTGLTGCTVYWYKAWEVNDPSGTPLYSNPAEGSQKTAAVEAPTGLTVVSTNASGAVLGWTGAMGASGYDVEVWHYGEGWGEPKTVVYTNASLSSVKTNGTAPAGSHATFSASGEGTYYYMEAGDTMTLTLYGWDGCRITGISLRTCSDTNDVGVASGGGSFRMQTSGGNTIARIEDSQYCDSGWYGAWETVYWRWIDPAVTPTVVGAGETVTIQLACSESWLWYDQCEITYETPSERGRLYDWENGAAAGGSSASVTVDGTTATVTGLAAGTEYGWSVAALGGDCEEGADGPDFETPEVVSAPTVTPVAGTNQVTGTVTGSADADTVWLYRFDDKPHADAAVLSSTLGGTRVTNVTASGEGSWTFEDKGLLGCTTYWYRAWLTDEIDGVTYTSPGSSPVSAQTELAEPKVTAVGAGEQMDLSWPLVAGATGYTVRVSSTNTFTDGTPGTFLSENFNTTKSPTGWSFSGTGWYDNAPLREGTNGSAIKFDGTGDSVTTPAFGTGATMLTFWTYGNGGQGTFSISGRVNNAWTHIEDVTAENGAGTHEVALSTTVTQLLFSFTKVNNCALDNVAVSGPSGDGTVVYRATLGADEHDVTAKPLEQGKRYWYEVTAYGSEGCSTVCTNSALTEDAPLIELKPKRWGAGTVDKGVTATNTFTVRNRGTETLTFTSADIVPAGTPFSIASPTGSGKTASIGPGESRTYVVTFAPTNSGTWEAKLRFESNAANGDEVDGVVVPGLQEATLTGTGYDPETAAPDVLKLEVVDGLGIDGTVWDHSLALLADAPVLKVTAWHKAGIWTNLAAGTNAATWTLREPDGNVVTLADGTELSGKRFTGVRTATYGHESDCVEFSAAIPALGAGRAVRGDYSLEVTVKDASGRFATTATSFLPTEEESVAFDDFTRADVVADGTGKLQRGWTAIFSGAATASEAAIHDRALELYGETGTSSGAEGRIGVVRDMGDVGYATTPHEFEGTGSWGFHFQSAAQLHGWDGSSMVGAYVLGSTLPGWLSTDSGQAGLAVTLTTNGVQLASFRNSLLKNGSLTPLGDAWAHSTAGKTLAVRVELIAGHDAVDAEESDDGAAHPAVPAKLALYVKEVSGTGGDPTAECGADDRVTQVDVPAELATTDLPYGGVLWAHGTGPAGAANSARFDDIHLPRMDGQSVPMTFHCVDDDPKAPTFEGFSVPAAIAAATAASEGLRVTGTILDPSGLWMDVSGTNAPSWETAAVAGPRWELWVNGAKVAEDAITGFAGAEDENGESTSVAVDFTIPSGSFDAGWRTTNCVVVVKAWDFDIDRAGDSLSGEGRWRFTLCDSTPTAPAWATVEADGAEMAVLRWAWTNGANYVVVRGDAEIGAEATPPQGTMTTPTTGSVYAGLGTVVYAGAGDNHLTNGWTAREILVKPGSANYFAVYGMSGGDTGYYFSSPTRPMAYTWTTTNASGEYVTHWATEGGAEGGKPAAGSVASNAWPCVTAAYEPGEGVDSFAYRTSVSYPTNKIEKTPADLALEYGYEERAGTGSGWSTNEPTGWQGDTNKWKIHDGSLLTGGTGYPTPTGNKLYWQDTSGSLDEAKLTRWLDAPESGDFFVAAILNYTEPHPETGATNKWIEIALVDEEGNDIATFGKPRWNSYNAAIQYNNGQYGGFTQYTLNSGHGNDYIVVGQLSRTDSKFRMWVYNGGGSDKIPEVFSKKTAGGTEVGLGVSTTALNTVRADCSFVGTPANVAGIQLRAGSESGKELGHVYFDEVRFAATWEELMLFNEPEVESYDLSLPAGSGKANGTNDLGQTQWLVSDGALAHSDVGLNASFELYHRTGIESASFQILGGGESKSNLLREVTSGTTAATGNTAADVALTGARGSVYGEWTTPDGGATGMAIPTNWISLGSNYVVQVSLHSTGGREAEVTSATDNMGGGATDLFFGEYGEGCRYDKYVELYNGTGRSIDLSQYYLARANKGDDTNYSNRTWFCHARITNGTYMLPHKTTVVLINKKMKTESDTTYRYDKMVEELQKKRCRFILMTNDVLDAGGSVPIVLLSKAVFDEADAAGRNAFSPTNKPWLDACGDSTNKVKERFIMSRKADASPLPRANLPVTLDEWDYRNWSVGKEHDETDDYESGYGDFITTAGGYDRAIGLGGTMEFRVYDDDEEPPALAGGGQGGGLRLKAVAGDAHPPFLPSTAGDRTYVAGGWSFTNYPAGVAASDLVLTNYQWVAEMWPNGLTTSGGLSWSPHLGGTDLAGYANVIKPGSGKGQSHVEFDGIEQRRYGAMSAKAGTNYFGAPDKAWLKSDKAWLGFDLDLQDLAEPTLSFGYMGGSSGFSNACVSWSATGAEGSFATPDGWSFSGRTDSTWTEWSQSLDGILPKGAGHVWFRVMLWDYGNASGAFWLDNIRVEGNPRAIRVTDEELADRGVVFEVRVKDESGVDAGAAGTNTSHGAKFETGLGASMYRRTPGSTNIVETAGEATVTNAYVNIQWTLADGGVEKTGGFGKKTAQDWYAATQGGEGQLKVEVGDLDDDRANDQSVGTKNFGMLVVEDDDDEGPQIRMKTMKPRLDGVVGEWLFKEKAWGATDEMDGVDAGALGVCTTNGTVTQPRASLRTSADTGLPTNTYAVYQTGWQAGSKYWTATLHTTGGGKGFVTNISFWSKVGSVNAPTKVELWTKTGEEDAVPVATNSLLAGTDTAWAKESEESTTSGTTIGVWRAYNIGLEGGNRIELPMDGTPVEIRLMGTGGSPKGIGASWFLWDLKMEGELEQGTEGEEESYTYKTDHEVASGAGLDMEGSVWDEGSGLAGVPTWEMTEGITGSGTVTFSSEGALSNRTTRTLGAFRADLPVSTTYTGLELKEYRGTITATDADNDRNSADDGSGTNYDSLTHTGKFGFTVVDQDVTRPTAPTGVKVNGVDVPGTVPERTDPSVAWTNKPEFVVSFAVAVDQNPSTNWTNAAWTNLNVVGDVMKTNIQAGVSGIGEYRVSLTTDTADGVGFSVAVTNGAVANGGFEETNATKLAWTLTNGGEIRANGEKTGMPDSAAGTHCLWVPGQSTAGSATADPSKPQYQVFAFANRSGAAPQIGGTLQYYLGVTNASQGPSPRVRFDAYTDSAMTNRVAAKLVTLRSQSVAVTEDGWRTWTLDDEALGDETVNCIRVALYNPNAGSYFDEVRIRVKVGDGTEGTMRYVADADAQGLNAKYLFAVDADDDRVGDALEGGTALFYTAYDCTPPTAVAFTNHNAASTDSVDDPMSQFDVTWLTDDVGPNDTNHVYYKSMPSALQTGLDSLSPWRTYKFYCGTHDPEADTAEWVDAGSPGTLEDWLTEKYITRGVYKTWTNIVNGQAIEDPAVRAAGTNAYSGLDTVLEPETPLAGTTSRGGRREGEPPATRTTRLYDLENDQDYIVVVVGVDKAGNEGPANANSWATNNTIKFAITQGVVRTRAAITNSLPADSGETALTNKFNGTIHKHGAALYWLAAGMKKNEDGKMEGRVTKEYDLIYRDAASFTETGKEKWTAEGTTKTNWNYQAGDFGTLGRGKLRFYRASYKNRWLDTVTNGTTVTEQRPLASEDVYSMNRVPLREGMNLVGLQGMPYTNTLLGLLGTNWPVATDTPGAAPRFSDGTRVEFFSYNTNGVLSTNQYWFTGGSWWDNDGHDVSSMPIDGFLGQSFSITLPDNLPPEYREFTNTVNNTNNVVGMNWYPILQVPTNGPSQLNLNPKALGWKELVGTNYVASTNTSVNPEKRYWEQRGAGTNATYREIRPPKGGRGFSVKVTYGGRRGNARYTLVSLNLPVAVNVADMNLLECGFQSGDGISKGDVIYTMDNVTKQVRDKSLIYHDGTQWRNAFGGGGLTFYPNDAILIMSLSAPSGKAEGDTWTWTYWPEKFYDLPTRWMGR